jgi:Fe-S-cluster containining protein
MTLTEADVVRLEGAGFDDFVRRDHDGDLVLVNRAGACVFLDDGVCRSYEVRPEGCRAYPLVLDLNRDRVVLDELCPHRSEFSFGEDDVEHLKLSVHREEAERHRRRRADG